jgi:signal transduction histidine kinase
VTAQANARDERPRPLTPSDTVHARIAAAVGAEVDVAAAEHELLEKTRLLEATLANMEQGLLVLGADLRIRAWNDRCVDLLDLPADAMAVGRPVEHLMRVIGARGDYGPGDLDTIVETLMVRLARCEPPVFERRRPNGGVIEQRRVRMRDGGILVTYSDVTERRRVEADLERARDEAELASRSKTEFLANMSHELRTPLNAVIGFSDILAGELFGQLGDRRYRDYAHDIRESGLHLLKLINDVLDVAKIEHGTVDINDELVDVGAAMESCVRLVRERAAAARVSIGVNRHSALPLLRADSRRLKQILINLLSNAVKFTRAGGSVTVAAEADERGYRISVSDTGIGIAAEDLATAFQPFGQIDSSLARKYQGTGLGLPISKAMAELHGGGLELASTPGEGTTATLWLPPERISAEMSAVAD